MTNQSKARTELSFSNLDEVTSHLNLLLEKGYSSLGKWNLAQVCEHCRDWMLYPLDGYPKAPFPINIVLWIMKVTVGRSMVNKVITTGKMPAGRPTFSQTIHSADGIDDESSVRRFKEAINRFKSHLGPVRISPLFGELTQEDALKLQLAHCAHHLSFLALKS